MLSRVLSKFTSLVIMVSDHLRCFILFVGTNIFLTVLLHSVILRAVFGLSTPILGLRDTRLPI